MRFFTYDDYLNDLENNRIEYMCRKCEEKYDEEYFFCPKCEARMKEITKEDREMEAADRMLDK